MSEKTNYPLSWPEHWPRARFQQHSKFHNRTVPAAVTLLCEEVNRLNNRNPGYDDPKLIISTNIKPNLRGVPAGGQSQPQDRGAAVYFELKTSTGKTIPVALACDKWNRVEDNLWAIAKHIEALRAQERWGVGKVEQAFRGYTAIPEKTGRPWWTVLGIGHEATPDQVRARFLELSKTHHPDKGGDHNTFIELKAAYDTAMAQLG